MNKLVLCLALCAAPVMASAADMAIKAPPPPPPPILSWTGGYVGVVTSYVENRNGATETGIDFFGDCNECLNLQRVIEETALDQHFKSKGVGLGLTFGWNLQVDRNIVLGVESDLQYLAVKGSRDDTFADTCPDVPGPCRFTAVTTSVASKMNWFGTARVRAGWLIMPSTLVYATGGFAYAQVENTLNINGTTTLDDNGNNPFGNNVTRTDFRTGWTAGGGIEQRFGPSFSIKSEFLYYNLGHSSLTNTVLGINAWACCTVGGLISKTNSYEFKGEMVRVGANWKFN